MSLTQQTELIRACLVADVPVLLWGPPGVGKSAAVKCLARDRGAACETLDGTSLDAVDLGDYLVPSGDGVTARPPPWAARLTAAEGERILFLDELAHCSAPVQAGMQRIAHERRCGSTPLGCRIVAAANPEEWSTAGGGLAPAVANRFAHVQWTVDVDEWCEGELGGWGAGLDPELLSWQSTACGFLAANPSALLDPALDRSAWPSPRSWSAAIRLAAQGLPWSAAARACVGDGAASEFTAWLANADLPSPEEVLAGRASLPDRGDRLVASLVAVVTAATAERDDRDDRDDRMARAAELVVGVRADRALLPGRVLARAWPADGVIPSDLRELLRRAR